MRKYGKIDVNQNECVEAARRIGAEVYITSMLGKGFPDAIVIYRGKIFLIEFKRDAKAKLTADQVKFHASCSAPIYIIITPEQLIEILTRETSAKI